MPVSYTHLDVYKRQGGNDAQINDINRVLDIPVLLSVELGLTKVTIKHILQLGQGSVVELDALAGEPMDVLVNGYLIAQGEVVAVSYTHLDVYKRQPRDSAAVQCVFA